MLITIISLISFGLLAAKRVGVNEKTILCLKICVDLFEFFCYGNIIRGCSAVVKITLLLVETGFMKVSPTTLKILKRADDIIELIDSVINLNAVIEWMINAAIERLM